MFLFDIDRMNSSYEMSPEMPDFIWISSSIVFGLEFCVGGVTNLTIVFCYLKNILVSNQMDYNMANKLILKYIFYLLSYTLQYIRYLGMG